MIQIHAGWLRAGTVPMAKGEKAFVVFSGGEWTPKMASRSDRADSVSACRKVRNFMLTIHGKAVRRPGFQYIQSVYDPDPLT